MGTHFGLSATLPLSQPDKIRSLSISQAQSYKHYFTDYISKSSACQPGRTFVHKLFTVTGTNGNNAIFLHRLNEKHHIISQ